MRRRNKCRLCENINLIKVFSLTPTPPANAFITEDQIGIQQEVYPLDMFFCRDCFHLQILDVLDPVTLFENYVYVTGTSKNFVNHFKEYAFNICEKYNLKQNSFVIEIGSNDGTFLKIFQELGMKVLGVDPAKDISLRAKSNGIETITNFFSSKLAEEIKINYGSAQVITANNVFAHADDLVDIVNGCKILLDDYGIFVFEVQYLSDLYLNGYFDMIYHEHLSYHSVGPLKKFFSRNGMELVDVSRVSTHGGSIRCVVQKNNGNNLLQRSVKSFINEEKSLGLYQSDSFMQFAKDIDKSKKELQELIKGIKELGKSLAGFGAPAKTTTLMFHYGIDGEIIDYIVDDNTLKQGLFTPGYNIPIYSTDMLYSEKPDYLLILAWNFSDSIVERHRKFIDDGGHFIIPLPEVKII